MPDLALTGPAAAALYQLDGFTDIVWPLLWCGPISLDPTPNVIRSRRYRPPQELASQLVARPGLVLRHLNALDDEIYDQPDGINRRDRIELAAESAFRKRLVLPERMTFTGGPQLGGHFLREIVHDRGTEPATESFPETRLCQVLRGLGLPHWRQARIYEDFQLDRRILFRADFAVSLKRLAVRQIPVRRIPLRPSIFLPHKVLLIEVNGRQYHDNESSFEADHYRYATYDMLGYNYLLFTPTQIEKSPDLVRETIRNTYNRLTGRSMAI